MSDKAAELAAKAEQIAGQATGKEDWVAEGKAGRREPDEVSRPSGPPAAPPDRA
ncbi:hypothetical protein SAMN04489730_6269 [Amycolatopsis australiensis]|uniref:Uncharacterized protein n=1 Tax=Amycolatopsis australiensis TaxID=546364 RepID=A0A1K1SNI8_9PSEU|nr:hypothetical protein SAMN04489730_6269 [Amycolatopsis australiensis]